MPTPADNPFEVEQSGNQQQEMQFPDQSLPSSFEEVRGNPVQRELTLLKSEPATPTVISHEEHVQHLLGYMQNQFSEEDIQEDLMHFFYHPVRRSFYNQFLEFARGERRKNYEWLSSRGFEEPEDLLDADSVRNLVVELWNEFLQSGEPVIDSKKVDRAVPEELVARDKLGWQYLDQLPTEPDFDPERRERSEMAITGRDGWIKKDITRVAHRDEYGYDDRPLRQQNSRKRELNLVAYPPYNTGEVVEGLLSKYRMELTEKRYYEDFVPRVYSLVIGVVATDYERDYLSVGGYQALANLGLHEPEDLFCRAPVVEAFNTMFEFYIEDNDPIGPYTDLQGSLATMAYKRYDIIDERTYKQLRIPGSN